MTTAQVDSVAILNTPAITWEFAERPERPEAKPEIAREMVKAGTISQADVDTFATRNICGATRCGPMLPCIFFESTVRTCCCFTCSPSTRRSIVMVRARRQR